MGDNIKFLTKDQLEWDQVKLYTKMEGLTIENYIIIKYLNRGQFAYVFKAFDKEKRYEVAFKIVSLESKVVGVPQETMNYLIELQNNEIQFLTTLQKEDSNQNLITIIDHFQSQKLMFIIMELCDDHLSDILIDKLQQKQISIKQKRGENSLIENSDCLLHIKQADKWTIQLLNGYKALYDGNILHREYILKKFNILVFSLKHQNILIKGDVLKICDLGFGRENKKGETRGTYCGTQSTMSPEILQEEIYNNKIEYDYKSDVFSLGFIIFAIYHGGRYPIQDIDVVKYEKKIKEPEKIQFRPDIPEQLKKLQISKKILRMIEYDQFQRASWEEILSNQYIQRFDQQQSKLSVNLYKQKKIESINKQYDHDQVGIGPDIVNDLSKLNDTELIFFESVNMSKQQEQDQGQQSGINKEHFSQFSVYGSKVQEKDLPNLTKNDIDQKLHDYFKEYQFQLLGFDCIKLGQDFKAIQSSFTPRFLLVKRLYIDNKLFVEILAQKYNFFRIPHNLYLAVIEDPFYKKIKDFLKDLEKEIEKYFNLIKQEIQKAKIENEDLKKEINSNKTFKNFPKIFFEFLMEFDEVLTKESQRTNFDRLILLKYQLYVRDQILYRKMIDFNEDLDFLEYNKQIKEHQEQEYFVKLLEQRFMQMLDDKVLDIYKV